MATGLTMLFVLVMVVAMAWDAATLEIPDSASVVLVVGFLVGAIVRDAGLFMILQHVAAGLVLFASAPVCSGWAYGVAAMSSSWRRLDCGSAGAGFPLGSSWWRWQGACWPSPSSSCA